MEPPPPYAAMEPKFDHQGNLIPGAVPEPSAPLYPHLPYSSAAPQPTIFPPPPPQVILQPLEAGGPRLQPGYKVIYAIPLGPHPASMQCPNCHEQIVTRVMARAGLLAWLICGGLALIGCWPCCLMPLCMRTCQDMEHYCPKCHCFTGKYSRI